MAGVFVLYSSAFLDRWAAQAHHGSTIHNVSRAPKCPGYPGSPPSPPYPSHHGLFAPSVLSPFTESSLTGIMHCADWLTKYFSPFMSFFLRHLTAHWVISHCVDIAQPPIHSPTEECLDFQFWQLRTKAANVLSTCVGTTHFGSFRQTPKAVIAGAQGSHCLVVFITHSLCQSVFPPRSERPCRSASTMFPPGSVFFLMLARVSSGQQQHAVAKIHRYLTVCAGDLRVLTYHPCTFSDLSVQMFCPF